jgi:hypothetical protein
VLALAVLTGCGDTRQLLGLDKRTPDEFQVISRAPLSVPPDYALHVPEPGAGQRGEGATAPQQALAAITGGTSADAVSQSGQSNSTEDPGEAALLKQVGSDRALPDIRQVVNRENSVAASESDTFVNSLMFWRKPEDQSTIVDAPREAQRLRENAALGKPADAGETPTIQRRKNKGWLEDLDIF